MTELVLARAQVARVFSQRCFYLFVVLLGVLVCIPIADTSARAAALLTIFDALVLLAAVAAIGRTLSSFVLAVGLAIAVMLLQTAWRQSGDTGFMVLYLWFLALYLLATLVYLLTYVLRRDVMTLDKLYGAAAAYLLLAFCGWSPTASRSTTSRARSASAARPRRPWRPATSSTSA